MLLSWNEEREKAIDAVGTLHGKYDKYERTRPTFLPPCVMFLIAGGWMSSDDLR